MKISQTGEEDSVHFIKSNPRCTDDFSYKLDVGNREASALGVFGEGKYMKEETRRELYIVFLLGHIKLGKAYMEIM